MESRIRFQRRKPFVTIYREVAQDGRLSLETRGLFVLMASLPEDWSYTVSGLAKQTKCGKDRLRRMLGELEKVGYLIREQAEPGRLLLRHRCPGSPTTVNRKTHRCRKTPLTG